MSRKKKEIIKKNNKRDLFYNCYIVNKFINITMESGKKKKSFRIFQKSMKYIRLIFKKNPYFIFLKCVENAKPLLEIKKRKVGGSIFFVPIKISNKRSLFYALRNLRNNSIGKKKKMYISLANEIYNTYKGSSLTIKNRDEIHKTAENNRAFSHFLY